VKPNALRILVAGRLAAAPGQGGAAWALLQWVLGFRSLGHEVWLIEPLPPEPTEAHGAALLRSRQARYFRLVTQQFVLDGRAALIEDDDGLRVGPSADIFARAVSDSDLLVDISGVLAGNELARKTPVRLYVDLDPAFTQLWHDTGVDVGLAGHTHYATVGQLIGEPESRIPDCGKTWIHFLPPVALAFWPVVAPPARERFTTVANWRSYGSIEHDGTFFGQKAHSFREYVDLPMLTDARLEVALAISPGDRADSERLQQAGWKVLAANRVASTPHAYQRFIQRSTGEIGFAKSGYVAGRTGWFSDRSAAYLASGRPVVAQDTGLDPRLSDGVGLLAFANPNDAAAAIERVRRDYAQHAAAARRFAEQHLDARKVLTHLLRQLGMTK
jgi:hypothetical protein